VFIYIMNMETPGLSWRAVSSLAVVEPTPLSMAHAFRRVAMTIDCTLSCRVCSDMHELVWFPASTPWGSANCDHPLDGHFYLCSVYLHKRTDIFAVAPPPSQASGLFLLSSVSPALKAGSFESQPRKADAIWSPHACTCREGSIAAYGTAARL
jgi:hypothetical protein